MPIQYNPVTSDARRFVIYIYTPIRKIKYGQKEFQTEARYDRQIDRRHVLWVFQNSLYFIITIQFLFMSIYVNLNLPSSSLYYFLEV